MTTPSHLTLSASDIAKLADVGRSTVSNWRQRHADFPQPVAGDTGNPRFSKAEVDRWLTKHDKAVKDISPSRHLWTVMNGVRGTIEPDKAGEILADLIVWRYVADRQSRGFDNGLPVEAQWPELATPNVPGETVEWIHAGMRVYEESHPERAPLFYALHQGSPDYARGSDASHLLGLASQVVGHLGPDELEEAYGVIQDQLTRSVRRGYDDLATSEALVDLVAALASGTPGPVHDPAVGSGRMLMTTARSGENRSTLTGQDIYLGACIQTNQRVQLAGHAQARIAHGDVLRQDMFSQGLAQVVVMDPPYGLRSSDNAHLYLDPRLPYGVPPKSNMDLAWLQLSIWYLGAQGRAFVLQPAGSAFRGGAEAKIRAAMLQAGTIESIIGLPAGLASHTRIPLNLWILARPGETSDPNRVLMIDHSETKTVDPEALAEALQGWRADRAVPEGLPAEAVSVTDILADKADVNPRRWVASGDTAPGPEDVRSAVESLHQAAESLQQPAKLTAGSIAAGTRVSNLVSITDLEKAGSLKILKARETIREADYGTNGSAIMSGAWIRGNDDTRRVDLSLFERDPLVTEVGDVLLQNTGGLAARVDTDGGRVLVSPTFQLLRPIGATLRPEFLAEFIVSTQNQSQAQGAAIQRVRLQDMKIPLPPLEEQDRILESLAEARAAQESARVIGEAAGKARHALVDAFTAGTITIS